MSDKFIIGTAQTAAMVMDALHDCGWHSTLYQLQEEAGGGCAELAAVVATIAAASNKFMVALWDDDKRWFIEDCEAVAELMWGDATIALENRDPREYPPVPGDTEQAALDLWRRVREGKPDKE